MPTAKARAQCRVPVPSPMLSTSAEPNAGYQCRALLLTMGADEADGGRRGQWGQARVVEAGETGGGRRGQWGL